MFCSRYRRLLIPYAECGLDERVRARVEAHLAKCPSCAAELRVVRSVSAALRQADTPAAEPAHDLWARVNERITSPTPAESGPAWLGIPQVVTALAGVVLVAIVGLSLMRTSAPVQEARLRKPKPAVSTEKTIKPVEPRKIEVAPTPRRPGSSTRWFVRLPKRYPRTVFVAAVVVAKPEESLKTDTSSALSMRGPTNVERVPEGAESLRDERNRVAFVPGVDAKGTPAPAPAEEARVRLEMGYSDRPSTTSAGDTTTEGIPKNGLESAGAELKRIHFYSNALSFNPPPSVVARGDEELAAGSGRLDGPGVGTAGGRESVVDILNRTEGVHVVALFSYP